jgi:hypothetical protein
MDEVIASLEDLPKLPRSSRKKILIRCDTCGDVGLRSYDMILISNRLTCSFCLHSIASKNTKGFLKATEAAKSPESKEKRKKTMLEKYGVTSNFSKERARESLQKKYGVDNVSELNWVRKKQSSSHQSRTEDQIRESNEKRKKTCLKKFGHTTNMKDPPTIEKMLNTRLEKYGTRGNPNSGRKMYSFEGMRFDSSYELAYFLWMKDQGIVLERNTSPISYSSYGVVHQFYPDFVHPDGHLIEVKGEHLMKGVFGKNSRTLDKYQQTKDTVEWITDISDYTSYMVKSFGRNWKKKFSDLTNE